MESHPDHLAHSHWFPSFTSSRLHNGSPQTIKRIKIISLRELSFVIHVTYQLSCSRLQMNSLWCQEMAGQVYFY